MKRSLVMLLLALTSCQYVSYYKTDTTTYPAGYQSSPEVVCEEMGATRGTSELDWCIAREEDARAKRQEREEQ